MIEHKQIARGAEVLVLAQTATLREQRREIRRLVALRHQAANRLEEIERGAAPRFPDEEATAWAALQLAASMLRRAEAAYCIVAVAAASTRYAFCLHPERREEMIDCALADGFVRDARDFRIEVGT
jgi:hypothetical protein